MKHIIVMTINYQQVYDCCNQRRVKSVFLLEDSEVIMNLHITIKPLHVNEYLSHINMGLVDILALVAKDYEEWEELKQKYIPNHYCYYNNNNIAIFHGLIKKAAFSVYDNLTNATFRLIHEQKNNNKKRL